MTLKNYLKDKLANCLFKNETIDFESIYKEYVELKNLGDYITSEYKTNKIIADKNSINIPTKLISRDLGNDSKIRNFITNNQYSNIDFSILSHAITTTLKKVNYKINYTNTDKATINIDSTLITILDNINLETFLSHIPDALEKYGKVNNCFNMNELLSCFNNTGALENYLNFLDKNSLFFHMLMVEIVYYTYKIEFNSGHPKTCPSCHKPHYGHTRLCSTCNKKRINERRKINAKCDRIRNKLQKYIKKYNHIIPLNIINQINEMNDNKSKHKYTYYDQLLELKNKTETFIDDFNIYKKR